MANYAKQLPVDKNGGLMTEFSAPFQALARYTTENGTASSVITVSADTTTLEVAAVGGASAIRWVTTADTEASIITIAGATANYDHIIPASTVRRFVIPKETAGTNTGAGSIVGINPTNGLFRRVALKSMGVASVLISEF